MVCRCMILKVTLEQLVWIKSIFKREITVDLRRESTLALVSNISDRYLDRYIGTPYEMFARTVSQFHGSKSYRPYWQVMIRRFASISGLVIFFFSNCFKRFSSVDNLDIKPVEGVKTGGDLREYELPPELANNRIETWDPTSTFLPWKDVMALFMAFIAIKCWEPEVYYRSLLALSDQVGLFRKFQPQFVLLYREYDFTCSILVHQCHTHGVQAYNVMHGDKAYVASDAFFRVDRYYVWHKGYAEIAINMKACPGEVVVFTPYRMLPQPQEAKPIADLLLILPPYSLEVEIENLWIELISRLSTRWKLRLRPHPRYQYNSRLQAMVNLAHVNLSDPKVEGAVDAIRSVRAVVGLQSTMLIEAFHQEAMVFCIQDSRLDQIQPYHPYFNNKEIHIMPIALLPDSIEMQLR